MLTGVFASSGHNAILIMLICLDGKRSEEASKRLIEKTFKHVYRIGLGFEGNLDDKHQRRAIGRGRFNDLS